MQLVSSKKCDLVYFQKVKKGLDFPKITMIITILTTFYVTFCHNFGVLMRLATWLAIGQDWLQFLSFFEVRKTNKKKRKQAHLPLAECWANSAELSVHKLKFKLYHFGSHEIHKIVMQSGKTHHMSQKVKLQNNGN